MLNITTSSDYLTYPNYIPLAVSEAAGVDVNENLDALISNSEETVLLLMLGEVQYTELQTELSKLPFNPQSDSNALQYWIDFVNGSGAWKGIRQLLKDYIYCEFLREDEVQKLQIGVGKGTAEGFTQASLSSKYAIRWNVMVSALEKTKEYLEDSADLEVGEDFPCWETVNSLGI